MKCKHSSDHRCTNCDDSSFTYSGATCSVHGMNRNACRCSNYDKPPPIKINFNLGWLVLIVAIGLGLFVK